MAVMAEGSIGTCKTSEKVVNIEGQKLSSFQQDQNMCERVRQRVPLERELSFRM